MEPGVFGVYHGKSPLGPCSQIPQQVSALRECWVGLGEETWSQISIFIHWGYLALLMADKGFQRIPFSKYILQIKALDESVN